jgi:hypothetical protein
MIKKFTSITLAFLISSSVCTGVFAQDIGVKVNDAYVEFASGEPFIESGRTLIPLRGVFEKMGYSVSWDGDTKTAELSAAGRNIKITANADNILSNGSSIQIDVPAKIVNGSMYIPLRAVGEASGAIVSWDSNTKTASIYTSALSENTVNSSVSEYVVKRSALIRSLDTEDFYKLIYSVSAENFYEKTSELKSSAQDMLNKLATAKSGMNALAVPSGFEKIHSLGLSAIDNMTEVCNILIYICDDTSNYDYNTAMERLNSLTKKANEINNDMLQEINDIVIG